jgi:hypothetical protein
MGRLQPPQCRRLQRAGLTLFVPDDRPCADSELPGNVALGAGAANEDTANATLTIAKLLFITEYPECRDFRQVISLRRDARMTLAYFRERAFGLCILPTAVTQKCIACRAVPYPTLPNSER